MTCLECGKPIHPERHKALPNAKTCSAECSKARLRKVRKRNKELWLARKKGVQQ